MELKKIHLLLFRLKLNETAVKKNFRSSRTVTEREKRLAAVLAFYRYPLAANMSRELTKIWVLFFVPAKVCDSDNTGA